MSHLSRREKKLDTRRHLRGRCQNLRDCAIKIQVATQTFKIVHNMFGPTQNIEEIQASEAPTLVKILHQHKVLTLIETRVTSGLGICPRPL